MTRACVQDEDPDSGWLLLCEEDLISFLSQFPFQQLYAHMLGMSRQGEHTHTHSIHIHGGIHTLKPQTQANRHIIVFSHSTDSDENKR